jgi:phosphoglycerate kinase
VAALSSQGARVVVLSHLGRPSGFDGALSLGPVAHALEESLGKPVEFAESSAGDIAELAVRKLKAGGVLVLENLRFHPGEQENQRGFAMRLALLGDIFVDDVSSSMPRKAASISAIREFLPAYAGPLHCINP